MASDSAALRTQIERAFPDRRSRSSSGTARAFRRRATGRRSRSARRGRSATFCARPGELGLGRAYVCGEIDVDDLDGVIALLGRWHAPPLGLAAAAAVRLRRRCGPPDSSPPPPPGRRAAAARRRRHTKRRDAEAVRHHYDVSNEFFALFLDETMTYSCALFEHGTETLEEAQRAKLELICRKLELEPGQRMLDIGCGWGSLAIHAAREHGASVWGSRSRSRRPSWRSERAREAGVDDRVEIRAMDYRDLRRGAVRRGRQHRHGRARRRGADRRVRARRSPRCWSRAAGSSTTASSRSPPESAAPTSAASSRTATCSRTASCSTSRACCAPSSAPASRR